MSWSTARIEAGYVLGPERATWLQDFQSEITRFPYGHHDDQVDSVSQFLRWLERRKRQVCQWVSPHHIISAVIDRVIVHKDALELRLQRDRLAMLLGTEPGSDDPIHGITSPCKLARRGQDLKFILPLLEDSNTFSRKDPALIQAVAKAQIWWRWIKKGEVKSLSEIAKREGIDKPKVTRLLRLAFLSPWFVRQIRDGEQPVGITVKTLTREHDLPRLWQEQEALVTSFR